jgi:hypothetical protein
MQLLERQTDIAALGYEFLLKDLELFHERSPSLVDWQIV